jgi:arylsulfatase
LLFLALALIFALTVLSAQAAGRPNVLLVLFDDLGFSDLGCYGGEIPTPNLDSLGKGGLRFTQMSNSARCCPSRASLLTGLHPGQAGIPNMGGELNDQCVTLAEVLGDAGYLTYGVGKWHVGAKHAIPTARGFQEFYGYINGYAKDQWSSDLYLRLPEGRTNEIQYGEGKFYATDAFNDYAIEFLQQASKKDKPWFLYLAHSSPHFPIQAPMESAKPMIDTYRKGWDTLRIDRFARLKEIGLINHDGWKLTERSLVPVDTDAVANGYAGKQNPAWDTLPEDRKEDLSHRMALYAAMVKHVDDGMGRIIEQLKRAGSFENTIILILSDNGACYEWGPFGFDEGSRKGITHLYQGDGLKTMGGVKSNMAYGSAWANLCNTPFRLYKHFTHQGGMVTPFIIHWPSGVKAPGRWVRDPAHIMDIMPTLVELAKATYPKERSQKAILPMEGVSLTPTFQPEGTLAERSLCYQHEGARAIIKQNWKLVYGKKFPTPIAWELYDLSKDPCETIDLAQQSPERVKELTAEYDAWALRCIGSQSRPKPNDSSEKRTKNRAQR